MSHNLTSIFNKGYSSIGPNSLVTLCTGKRIPGYVIQHASFILNDLTGATINHPESGILLYFDRSVNSDEYVLKCENKLNNIVILLQWSVIGFKF